MPSEREIQLAQNCRRVLKMLSELHQMGYERMQLSPGRAIRPFLARFHHALDQYSVRPRFRCEK
jgi:hypothetical protein